MGVKRRFRVQLRCPVGRPLHGCCCHPQSHPYTYDAYVQWIKLGMTRDKAYKGDGSAYSDRILEWDWDKHNRLCQKHFGDQGQMWDNRKPAKIEAFLQDFFCDQTLELTMIVASCNVSSGYPLWVFLWKTAA